MALYVLLLKDLEDPHRVVYRFGPSEEVLGRLQLVKATGDVTELESVPAGGAHRFFAAAATKVRQHWRLGAFPERSSWAS